jgi:hypothetical protein
MPLRKESGWKFQAPTPLARLMHRIQVLGKESLRQGRSTENFPTLVRERTRDSFLFSAARTRRVATTQFSEN